MNAYMTDDIRIIRYAGFDSWNQPLAIKNVEVKGRIEYQTRLVMDSAGEKVISSASILFQETIDGKLYRNLIHEDVLKFDGVKHTIIRIDTPKAFSSFFVFKYRVFVS